MALKTHSIFTTQQLQNKYFLKEEMTKEIYDQLFSKLVYEQAELLGKIEQAPKYISNLTEQLTRAVIWRVKLPSLQGSVPLAEKEVMQKLVFPDGLAFDKKNIVFRTDRMNEIAELSVYLSMEINYTKKDR